MNVTAALTIAAGVWLAVVAWRRHHRRIAEQAAMDREYRESVVKRERVKPRNEEEEDYLLKLRAGVKSKTLPPSQAHPKPAGSPNKFMD
jgi:hypothetical protein